MKTTFVVLAALLSTVAALPQDAKELRKSRAQEADLEIEFITPTQLDAQLSSGTHIIFFGAQWCQFTQSFTPEYLDVQSRVKTENLFDGKSVQMKKLDCTNEADYCTKTRGVTGYPSIFVYQGGLKLDEYNSDANADSFYGWVKEKVKGVESEPTGSAGNDDLAGDHLVLSGGSGDAGALSTQTGTSDQPKGGNQDNSDSSTAYPTETKPKKKCKKKSSGNVASAY